MTKFSPELFMAEFLSRLEVEFHQSGAHWGGTPMVSTSRIALGICREYRYPMWANREEMNRLINEWYHSLPSGPSFTKMLFGRPTTTGNAWSASFISIGYGSHGLRCRDFISLLSADWGKDE